MQDYKIVTVNTPVVKATKKNDSIALVRGKPLIYHKVFDINEFIGEELSNVRGVNSVHYFPVVFGKLKRCLGADNDSIWDSNFRVGSYDFTKEGIIYKTCDQFPWYFNRNSFDILLEKCKDDENRERFVDSYLELMGLDIFMGQTDRGGNIMYEIHSDGEITLSPLFDYEMSFDDEWFSMCGYVNDFFRCLTIDDYQRLMVKYPKLESIFKSYADVSIEERIRSMAHSRGFILDEVDMEPYERFDVATHKRLEKILK